MEETSYLGKYQVTKAYKTSNLIMRVIKILAVLFDILMLIGIWVIKKLATDSEFLGKLPQGQAEMFRQAGEAPYWWISLVVTAVGLVVSIVMVYFLFKVKGEHFNLVAQIVLTLLPLLNLLIKPADFSPLKLALPLVWVGLTYLMYKDRDEKRLKELAED